METEYELKLKYLTLQYNFLVQQRELNALQTEKVQQMISDLYMQNKQEQEEQTEE